MKIIQKIAQLIIKFCKNIKTRIKNVSTHFSKNLEKLLLFFWNFMVWIKPIVVEIISIIYNIIFSLLENFIKPFIYIYRLILYKLVINCRSFHKIISLFLKNVFKNLCKFLLILCKQLVYFVESFRSCFKSLQKKINVTSTSQPKLLFELKLCIIAAINFMLAFLLTVRRNFFEFVFFFKKNYLKWTKNFYFTIINRYNTSSEEDKGAMRFVCIAVCYCLILFLKSFSYLIFYISINMYCFIVNSLIDFINYFEITRVYIHKSYTDFVLIPENFEITNEFYISYTFFLLVLSFSYIILKHYIITFDGYLFFKIFLKNKKLKYINLSKKDRRYLLSVFLIYLLLKIVDLVYKFESNPRHKYWSTIIFSLILGYSWIIIQTSYVAPIELTFFL